MPEHNPACLSWRVLDTDGKKSVVESVVGFLRTQDFPVALHYIGLHVPPSIRESLPLYLVRYCLADSCTYFPFVSVSFPAKLDMLLSCDICIGGAAIDTDDADPL